MLLAMPRPGFPPTSQQSRLPLRLYRQRSVDSHHSASDSWLHRHAHRGFPPLTREIPEGSDHSAFTSPPYLAVSRTEQLPHRENSASLLNQCFCESIRKFGIITPILHTKYKYQGRGG